MEGIEYHAERFVFAPGDAALLYTDGVTEASDALGRLYGRERLAALLSSPACASRATGSRRGQTVLNDVRAFAGTAPQADDITIVSFAWMQGAVFRRYAAALEEIENAQAQVRAGAPTQVLTAADGFALDLMVEEVFANIVRHGYGEDDEGRAVPVMQGATVGVETAYDAHRNLLHLVFCDEARAYDPCGYEARLIDSGAENEPGGLGVHLVRSLAASMLYERVGKSNVLHVTRKLEGVPEGAAGR